MTPPVDARAWGWVAHLREGGTTAWADWTRPGMPPAAPGDPAAAVVPSAQQLELLRRLNGTGRPDRELVERVLASSPAGRGQPDLELVGAVPDSRWGPRPVDPGTLRAGELLRVAALLVAEDLAAAGAPDVRRPGPTRPWRRRYRLVGDAELADPLRDHLIARGRPPGGRGAVVLVLAAPLDRMLAHVWTRRSFDHGPPAWPAWVQRLAAADELPPGADPLREARRWAERVGRSRVEVVLDPAAVGRRVGVRRGLPLCGESAEPAAVVPDLARRVAALLGLFVPAEERVALLRRRLRPRLAGVGGPPLALPERCRAWAQDRADRVADGLRRDGYAVHGRLEALRPTGDDGVTSPDPEEALDLALRLVLDRVGGLA